MNARTEHKLLWQPNMPFKAAQLRAWGYTEWRCLPDGTVLAVGPMLFGNGRLFVDVNPFGYEDCYCYDSVAAAVKSMQEFDPANDKEPDGWKRHPMTGRRQRMSLHGLTRLQISTATTSRIGSSV